MNKQEKINRAEEMFELYKSGVSQEKIGEKFGCTRQRVQQILIEYFSSEYDSAIIKHRDLGKAVTLEKRTKTLVCKNCSKSFTYVCIQRDKLYCTDSCANMSMSINQYPDWMNGRSIKKKNFTTEEWKTINRIKTHSYYQRNKTVQAKKMKEYQRKNSKNQNIYNQRCRERKEFGHAITPLINPKNLYAVKQ